MIKILDKSGNVLIELNSDTLRGANLRGANLRGANLSGADIIIITWSHWPVYITKNNIRIGCQAHGLEEWKNFSDEEISSMDSRALDFWTENKELIIGLCERFNNKK